MVKKGESRLEGRFWVTKGGKTLAGKGRIELLKRIETTGSISKAAKEMGMSYKAAWDSIDIMNNLSDKPFVERITSGKQGGGTILTKEGQEFIYLYEKYSSMFEKALQFMKENPNGDNMLNVANIKTSADNTFFGEVISIEKGAVSAIIKVEIAENFIITASILNDAVDRLNISEKSSVCCLINANQFTVMASNSDVSISARNIFKGKVKLIKKGAVNSEIAIELNNNCILNVLVTNESVENMQISYGMDITAFCKASSVIILYQD